MQPSSLIFLAVVAIWGAFLVQYWVRRREDVATARSADRFSAAMHVLERRPVLPAADPRPPFARYAVGSPLVARGTRASATVIRPAEPVGSTASTASTASPAAAPIADGHDVTASQRPDVTASQRPDVTASQRPGVTASQRTSAGLARSAGSARSRRPRRITPRIGRAARGVTLVLTLVALPVVVTAAILGLLPWASLLVWAGLLIVLLVSLRAAAVRERTRRHTAAQLAATDPRASTAGARRPVPDAVAPRGSRTPTRPHAPTGTRPGASRPSARPGASRHPGRAVGGHAAVRSPVPTVASAVASTVASGGASTEATTVATELPVAGAPGSQPTVVVEVAPQVVAFADFGVDPTSVTVGPPDEHSLHGQWSPVDVPPPTYTLKAKATHPLPDGNVESTSEAQLEGEPTTATLGVVDVDDDDVPARWVVGG